VINALHRYEVLPDPEDEGNIIFETSVAVGKPTQHNVPKDSNLELQDCENFKSLV
jgi:hypothetical protein